MLDTSAAQYRALNARAVRVTGSRFFPSQKYTVRIEGAALVGYRSIVVAGIRDPLVFGQLPNFTGLRSEVERKIAANLGSPPMPTLSISAFTGAMARSATSNRCHKLAATRSGSSLMSWPRLNLWLLTYCHWSGTPGCTI